jgi:hypothetical protein
MIPKAKYHEHYVGPRAIFDQDFIPPSILHRQKEENALFSMIKDSLTDNFSINILYQGIEGIGKKVIINKVIRDLNNFHDNEVNTWKIKVNCQEKNLEELIISILSEIDKIHDFKIDFHQILNCNLSDLWKLFKLACQKIEFKPIFVFNNVENLDPRIFRKFIQYGKEAKISLISTINKILRPSSYELYSQFDFKVNLNYFSYNQLYDILQQRFSLSFLQDIDKELIEYITDLIFEHYVPVPGKGVEILKELYPFLKECTSQNFGLFEIIQNQFDPLQMSDEFSMLSYISEEELLTLIFLDNLSNFFLKKRNYYINMSELKELYFVACENLDYKKSNNEFNSLIKTYQNIGIISNSRNTIERRFFMTIAPKQLKTIIDTVFTKF